MKKVFFMLLLFLFFIPRLVSADEGWTITSFSDEITIQSDGKVHVIEHISVDFQALAKHGIYRDIPLTYEDTASQKTYTEIQGVSVFQDSAPAKYTLEENGNNERVKIGDPNRTISGPHTYVIDYTVTGILRSYTDHDELYWNVTGNDWAVPITSASATVTIPYDTITKTTCYEGYSGSTTPCQANISQSKATFQTIRSLNSSEGLTIVVGYPKGLVPILTGHAPPTLLQKLLTPVNLLFLLLPFSFGTIYMIMQWLRTGRDFWFRDNLPDNPQNKGDVIPLRQHETTVVEFTPPENLRPAEIGVLIDQKADTLDITATIIDLATKGYVTIAEVPKKWLFGTSDYELTQTSKPAVGLYSYEQKLLSSLFASKKIVTISSLKTTFYDDLAEVKKKLYEHMAEKNYFVSNPETVRNTYRMKGTVLCVIAGIGFYIILQINLIPLVIGFGSLFLTGILIGVIGSVMPRRTAYGHELYRRSLGYKEFLSRSEKYRQQFFEKQNMLNDMLPYAMIFGVTEKFAKAMDEMGIKPNQPTWYTGIRPFYVASFGRDINSFSKSLSMAMASTPSKSGGFSGGGSGGGFGGGGGGSW